MKATAALTTIAGSLALLSLGWMTLDVGWGRRLRPLGPHVVRIAGPWEQVFDLIALPYLSSNPPRELRGHGIVIARR